MFNTMFDFLFQPLSIGSLTLANRIVMAPMGRSFALGGLLPDGAIDYYRRRAEGGTGLIITEGARIPYPFATNDPLVPRFYGDDALGKWRRVVEAVHAVGGRVAPQLWHVGLSPKLTSEALKDVMDPLFSFAPSGYVRPRERVGSPMTPGQVEEVIAAYAKAARDAWRLGFDAIELHGAHGYLIDQFFWAETNKRIDTWGGDQVQRTRFACEVVRAIRRATAPDFPILLRWSQWKLADYFARMVDSPQTLEKFLAPLVDSGVDVFDCSQRRFWQPEFPGSPLNLAGWTKKLTGKPAISVGSLSLDRDVFGANSELDSRSSFRKLAEMMERGDFDLMAVGRAMIANPDWAEKVRKGDLGALVPYSPELLTTLS